MFIKDYKVMLRNRKEIVKTISKISYNAQKNKINN